MKRIGSIDEKERLELLDKSLEWSHSKGGGVRDYWACVLDGGRMFVKIKPGGKVHLHADSGIKVHKVLQTNPDAISFVDGIPYILEEGGIYELAASLEHESVNNGETDRIPLVLSRADPKDIHAPPEDFCD